jgi:hypothetical protein
MTRRFFLAFCSLLAAAPLPADPPAAPPPKPGEIVVTGHGPDRDRRDRQAVGRIAAPVSIGGFDAQYGRWDVPICVGVAGLPPDHARLIADRIGQVADGLKIKVEGPGCHPNIYIVVTAAPDDFIRKAQVTPASLLSGVDLAQINDMLHSAAPVRWAGLADQTGRMGDAPIRNGDYGATHGAVMKTLGSLIKAPVKTTITRMIVLVDANRIAGMRYSTLSAYLAMVSLAQLRPNADAQMVDTVLSAFRDPAAAPEDMTDFDHAYLSALYAMRIDALGTAQKQQIVGRINDALNKTTTR